MSNENPAVYGEVGVGSYILNDYVLTVEEADEGYMLNIKKGSEEQTAQLLIGPRGSKGDKGDPGSMTAVVSGTGLSHHNSLLRYQEQEYGPRT